MKELLTIVALIVLAFALWAGVKSKRAFMVSAFLSVLGLLFFANLDQIEAIRASGSGFEATTRVIEEAETTIHELRKLAQIVAASTLSLTQRTGRVATGFSRKEQNEIKDSLLKLMTELKVTPEEQSALLSEWHRWERFDYVSMILGRVELPSALRDNTDIKELWQRRPEQLPAPEKIEEVLDKYDLLDDEIRDLIYDYRYYIEHQRHRRPEVWFGDEG